MRRSVRTLHRWLSAVFVLALLLSFVLTGAGTSQDSPLFVGVGVVIVAAIVSLLVTGVVLFLQYYLPRWRGASSRRRQRSAT